MQGTLIAIGVPVALFIAFLLIIGFTLSRLYRRATREISFVRTGLGGRLVVVDGGALVFPTLQELMPVNMKTLRLSVTRRNNDSLITQDSMRVDASAEFYVKVQGTEEGIAMAAQTLGNKTFEVEALRDMIEGKLVDGLRAVAAKMTMADLHEQRSLFVQQVQQTVSEDLLKNGLELESVSLTGLDQTNLGALDQNNVFNSSAIRQLTEVIAEDRKKIAQIEAETATAVARSKLEAAQHRLEIEREEEASRVEQAIEIEALRSQEEAEKANRAEEAQRAAEKARIDREQATRAQEIEQTKALELAEQERKIAIAIKSEEESRARAAADEARAAAVVAEESVTTARRIADAERQKRIAILAAEEQAERDATAIKVAASAERAAAADRAAALRELAEAEADQIRIRALAQKEQDLAIAEGREAIIAAENAISEAMLEHQRVIAKLDAMPKIVAEMARPAEKIGSITIHKLDGLGRGGANGTDAPAAAQGSLVEQVTDALASMMVQGPALKKLGESIGMSLEGGMRGILDEADAVPATAAPRIVTSDAAA